ncbi:hypothetical protein C8Q80DRAFT_447626 [Daedaleopsis nitida]|nr:hypothetical protein C8Q80DRAFT_447626 [Daedaleopsis nitida]
MAAPSASRPTPTVRAHDSSKLPIPILVPTPPPDVPSSTRRPRGFPNDGNLTSSSPHEDPRCSTDIRFCNPSESTHTVSNHSPDLSDTPTFESPSISTDFISSSSGLSNLTTTASSAPYTSYASSSVIASGGSEAPAVTHPSPPRPFDPGPSEHARSQASGIIAAVTVLALLASGVFLWFLRRGTFGSGTLFGFKYGNARFAAGGSSGSGTRSGRGAAGKMSDEEMAQMGQHNVTSLDMSDPPAYPGSSASALLAAKPTTKPSSSSSHPSSSASSSAPTLALALARLRPTTKAPDSPTWSASPSAFDNAYGVRAGSVLSRTSRTSGSATLVSQPTGVSVASAMSSSSGDDPFRSADDPHPRPHLHPPLVVDPFRSPHDCSPPTPSPRAPGAGHRHRHRHGADPFRSDEDSILELESLPRYESPHLDDPGPPRLSLALSASSGPALRRSLSRTSAMSAASGLSAVSGVSGASAVSGASGLSGLSAGRARSTVCAFRRGTRPTARARSCLCGDRLRLRLSVTVSTRPTSGIRDPESGWPSVVGGRACVPRTRTCVPHAWRSFRAPCRYRVLSTVPWSRAMDTGWSVLPLGGWKTASDRTRICASISVSL